MTQLDGLIYAELQRIKKGGSKARINDLILYFRNKHNMTLTKGLLVSRCNTIGLDYE